MVPMTISETSASAPVRTMLVDDHPLFRLGLKTLFHREAAVELIGEAASASDALDLATETALDVALIDLVMPGDGGIALTARLHALQPDCKILGLSTIDEPSKIAAMLNAGASGYVFKTQPIAELVEAIRVVRSGGRYLPPQVSAERIDFLLSSPDSPFDRLTAREREIAEHLVRGESNLDIATGLFISERTVETHRQRILKKLGAHSIVEVISIAVRCGFDVTRE
jgi:two-component system invasion response regulator UvrY